MEHSSPLAAMQPPAVLFGHCFRADPTSYPSFGSMGGLGSNPFNFKDLSMKRPSVDYFSVKPVGTSPTASLAADLSQNFHIDQSPQFATPRRSLFSSNIFGNGNRREESMTTPPLPSSSPAPAAEMMEMSPLPHKPPFTVHEIEIESPTLDCSPMETPVRFTPSRPAPTPLQESPLVVTKDQQERKRPSFLRPSLAKSKAQSFQLGMSKPSPESQAPPFRFQTKPAKSSLSNTASLEDMFNESPQRERPMPRTHSTNNLMNTARLRPPFQREGSGSHVRGNGSPSAASIRKSAHPLMRPRKQCRRSLSMFEHPADVMAEKEASFPTNAPTSSMNDIEGSPGLQLPHFLPEDQTDTLPRIEKDTLVELMNGRYNDRFDNIMVIDCRFEYEYEGGHITGAVNYTDKDCLGAELFANLKPRTALVLHCEYSAHRAPIMAKFIRHQDRAFNADQYPHLSYPDMYILDGGYSSFFSEHRTLCYPQNYVEMNAKEFEFACERGLGKVKQRSKLSRAQTYAFGELSPEMEDSPTAPTRCRNFGDRSRLLGSPFAESPASGRTPGRRMLSY